MVIVKALISAKTSKIPFLALLYSSNSKKSTSPEKRAKNL